MPPAVLLIDDDPAILSALGECFHREAYVVLRALTGHEGIALYELHRPEVVILDYRLPDASGISVLKSLRKAGAAVIMLSGYGDIPTAVEAIKEGAESFLAKPTSFHEIHAHVKRVLGKIRLTSGEFFDMSGKRLSNRALPSSVPFRYVKVLDN